MSFDFDAAVVGAGAVGLACGRALARRGLRVIASPDSRDPGTPMTRLRLQLSALHDSVQLDPLAESIARLNDSARLNVPLNRSRPPAATWAGCCSAARWPR